MKVTVKTIDAGSQDFELPDEVRTCVCLKIPVLLYPPQATVGQLKGQILEKMVGMLGLVWCDITVVLF